MKRMTIVLIIALASPLCAQDRVVPKAAKGGKGFGESWAQVPDLYKKIRIPEWPVPTDLKKWEGDRKQVSALEAFLNKAGK